MQTIHDHPSPTPATRTELSVTGMSCANCARKVTETLQALPGVAGALVSLAERNAVVRWKENVPPDPERVLQAVRQAGFEAALATGTAESSHEHHHAGLWGMSVLTGIVPTALLMVGEWVLRLGHEPWFGWASFVLASVVQVGPGRQFYRGAWNQLKAGASNMDTLVALGSTTAFAYSAWALFSGAGGHLYFMEAASIITLISVGHWVEARVGARASDALRQLMQLAPASAWRRGIDGTEQQVPVASLRPDDLVVLKPGDRIPTDGEVVEGASAVDESMLTGESVPVDKMPGANVYAGAVNQNGRLLVRVTSTGEETALARIVAAVQRAQTSRAHIQRLGDRVSSVFVPIVVFIALGAGLWWGLAPASARHVHDTLSPAWWVSPPTEGSLAAAFITAAAVLIVACPCAMGLATPAALMASANAAARRGILIRDGVALEKAGQVTAVLFDKTGTLTVGKPAVTHTKILPEAKSWGELIPINLATTLARFSSHPLSRAFWDLAHPATPLTDWEEIRGAGVQGHITTAGRDTALARLGSLRFLQEAGVELQSGTALAEEWSGQGATVLGLSVGRQLIALFALTDSLKPGAAQVVERLARGGLKIFMITGDNRRTAAAIARQAGIPTEQVFAEVRPEAKAEFVNQLQQRGERVAFVGDGINDAPALEQADLGVAVSRASDIAREAADIVLLKSDIEAVPESLGLARATLLTIRQNLFWAFFYNALGIPLAALGFMSPVLCAAAMGLSDLVVIGNALRLRKWKLPA